MTQPNDAIVEAAAEAIYRLFPGPSVGAKPEWFPRGNSLKQKEARDYARAALEAAGSVERERVVTWLHEMAAMPADAGFNSAGKTRRQILTLIASAIERGDHWPTPPSSDGGGNG